jgi:hypothetical protein
MLDLNAEITALQLLPQQAITGTVTGTGVAVSTLNTGDLDFAELMITGITGAGSIVVQLQGSSTLNGTYTNLATSAAMPSTAFAPVTANMTTPVRLPVDPRALPPFVRAVATVTGITAATIECQLFGRSLQTGFPSTSG